MRVLAVLIITVLSLALGGCRERDAELREPLALQQMAEVLPESGRAIFVARAAPALLKQCTRRVPESVEETWQPSLADAAAVDSALFPALREAFAGWVRRNYVRGREPTGIPAYYRQYGGLVIGGRRLIYANAFPAAQIPQMIAFLERHRSEPEQLRHIPPEHRHADYWHHLPVSVCDGGEWYFGALYDPEQKRVLNLEFNW